MATTSALSAYAQDELLDHIMGTGAWPIPAGTFLQLHTGAPGENGTANVASFTTRTEITTWAAAASRAISNSGATAITGFTTSETITHWSIHDAATAGNCLFYGDFTTSRAVGTGVTLTVADGDLDLDFADTDLCDYAGNAALEHVTGRTAMTSPAGLFVQLHTGDPGDDGTAAVANLSTRTAAGAFSAAASGATDNDAAIAFTGTATETISHASVHDAATNGNAYWNFNVDTPQAVAVSEAIEFGAGDLDFALT